MFPRLRRELISILSLGMGWEGPPRLLVKDRSVDGL